ncbi:hypothetical protein B0H11DRAFT_2094625 [Mycena galericulata]|nr:hypothetical protein B0H11DRAFT_2094625 [Mycena galericulata]
MRGRPRVDRGAMKHLIFLVAVIPRHLLTAYLLSGHLAQKTIFFETYTHMGIDQKSDSFAPQTSDLSINEHSNFHLTAWIDMTHRLFI